MAQERPVLRCQHRVRSGASGMTSGVPSVCRTEPARTNPDVQYNSQYAEERVNRSHNPTHLERGTSTCNHDETYRNRPPAYVLRSMVRRRPKTSTHETHAKPNDNTNTRCLNWLKFEARFRDVARTIDIRPTPSPTCDSWCDSATSDNRRSAGAGQERKQLGASYPGFRGGSAPVRVLPMSAVYFAPLSLVRRAVHPGMRNPRVCQNTEPAKDRSTGHGTPDRTGPLTSTL